MKRNLYILLFLINLIYCCSPDNDNSSKNNISTKIAVFGSDTNAIYQANINNGEDVTTYNLTQELGFQDQRIMFYARDYNPTVYFYTGPTVFDIDRSWEKNLDTGAQSEYEVSCGPNLNQMTHRPVSNENNIFWLIREYVNNQSVLSLKILNKNSKTCYSINLGVGSVDYFSEIFIFSGEYLLIYHANYESGQSVITKINSLNFTIEDQLLIDGIGGVALNNDKLYFFSYKAEYDFYEYNVNTFQLNRFGNFNSYFPYNGGVFNTSFKGTQMLIELPYAQPSIVSSHPAFFDLDKGVVTTQIDFYQVLENLKALYPNNPNIYFNRAKYKVDLHKKLVIGGYEYLTNQNEKKHGIYFTDFESKILKNVELNFEPGVLLIR